MRVLHTGDWHLGRSFGPVSLHDDQCAFVDWCVTTAIAEAVDLVIVAGDVYDRAVPPTKSIELFGHALRRLQSAGIRIVAIAGNHDGPERIAAYDELVDAAGVHIRGGYQRSGEPIRFDLADGPVDVVPVPYLDPVLSPIDAVDQIDASGRAGEPSAANDDGDRTTSVSTSTVRRVSHQAVVRRAIERSRREGLAPRSIAVAHAFVVGDAFDPVVCESERALSVGGSATVHASLFAGFSYTALGHLHQAQQVGHPSIRYSGTPLAYSFSETSPRQVTLVEIGPSGELAIESRRVPCGRGVVTITGTLRELLERPDDTTHGQFVRAVLTDPGPVLDAKALLLGVYPHVVEIVLQPARLGAAALTEPRQISAMPSPLDAAVAYWTDLYEAEPTDAERAVLAASLQAASH